MPIMRRGRRSAWREINSAPATEVGTQVCAGKKPSQTGAYFKQRCTFCSIDTDDCPHVTHIEGNRHAFRRFKLLRTVT